MTYRMYQLDPKSLSSEVETALKQYQARYGYPPSILESGMEIPLPEGMNLVTKIIDIPKNIILLAVDVDTESLE